MVGLNDYGFNGYQVPFIPRAARSARRRAPVNKVRGNQICAYNLLSSAADDILLEAECLTLSGSMSTGKNQTSAVKIPVEKDEENQVKAEPDSGLVSQANNQKCKSKNHPLQLNSNPGFSQLSTSDHLNNSGSQNLVVGNGHEYIRREAMEVDTTSLGYREASHCELDCQPKNQIKVELLKDGMTENDTMADMFSLDDLQYREQSYDPIAAADSNVKMSLYRDRSPNTFAHSRDSIHVVSRDDDDNSSGCTHPITIAKSLWPASRFGHQRTKKLLASRYQKQSSGLKKKQFCKSDGVSKPIYHSKNSYLDYLKSQKNYPFKKRKFLYCNYVLDSDGDISSESISDRPTKGRKEGASVSGQKICGAGKGSIAAHRRAFQSKNSQGMNFQPIKLRIKSFTVPELFIEIPETSTVGSLKRTVLEAVTPLLGGGLRVGVLVQGKKVKDDRRTLLQTGISHVNKLDALDFTLEPCPTTTSQTSILGDSFPCNEGQSLARYFPPSTAVQQTSATLHESHLENAGSDTASDHDSAPSPIGISTSRKTANSSALVALTAMDDALALNSKNQKRKQSESAQRRIRRPFSVVEVETLVEAVETLGTGRWRDVKLQAFDNSEHRTYVDLKDKWKTLVHTARISPQQRRGEPVPQELLDRVLTAHAYWSQQ